MTTKSRTSLKAQGRGKVWFTKLTLRDLTVPGAGPRGGIRWTTDGCPPPPTVYCKTWIR